MTSIQPAPTVEHVPSLDSDTIFMGSSDGNVVRLCIKNTTSLLSGLTHCPSHCSAAAIQSWVRLSFPSVIWKAASTADAHLQTARPLDTSRPGGALILCIRFSCSIEDTGWLPQTILPWSSAPPMSLPHFLLLFFLVTDERAEFPTTPKLTSF